ncbi:hypothetical protein M8C21_029279, partial [Ambrosia artemisiifolia]
KIKKEHAGDDVDNLEAIEQPSSTSTSITSSPSPLRRRYTSLHLHTPLLTKRVDLKICYNSLDTKKSQDPELEQQTNNNNININGEMAGSRTTSFLIFLLWGGLMYYIFNLAPNQTPTTDMYLVKKLCFLIGDDGFQPNPVIVSLWNIMGLWPIVYSMLLIPSGRSSKGNVPVSLFLILSFFLGAYALIPYFVLWRPPPPVAEESELKKWPLNFLESKLTAGVILAVGLGLIVNAGLATGDNWKEYLQYFGGSRLIHATSVDFALLSTFAPFWVYNDMSDRQGVLACSVICGSISGSCFICPLEAVVVVSCRCIKAGVKHLCSNRNGNGNDDSHTWFSRNVKGGNNAMQCSAVIVVIKVMVEKVKVAYEIDGHVSSKKTLLFDWGRWFPTESSDCIALERYGIMANSVQHAADSIWQKLKRECTCLPIPHTVVFLGRLRSDTIFCPLETTAAGLGLIVNASLATGDNWKEYLQYFGGSRLIHVTSIDFTLLSMFAPFWVYNDMTARKWTDKGFWLVPLSVVPFLGPALYVLLRPSLSSVAVASKQERGINYTDKVNKLRFHLLWAKTIASDNGVLKYVQTNKDTQVGDLTQAGAANLGELTQLEERRQAIETSGKMAR